MAAKDSNHRMITIRDLASETGLSVATISVVLNQTPKGKKIPWRTQKRIRRRPSAWAIRESRGSFSKKSPDSQCGITRL